MRGARKIEIPQLEMRDEAAGRGNNDVCALRKGFAFLFEADSVVASVDGNAVGARVVGETLQGLVDLLGQLTCRRHDEAVYGVLRVRLFAQDGKHREEIGRRLAGAGLCNADEVLALEEGRNATRLYGGTLFETHVPKCVEHVFAEGEVFKIDGAFGRLFRVFGRNLRVFVCLLRVFRSRCCRFGSWLRRSSGLLRGCRGGIFYFSVNRAGRGCGLGIFGRLPEIVGGKFVFGHIYKWCVAAKQRSFKR